MFFGDQKSPYLDERAELDGCDREQMSGMILIIYLVPKGPLR